MTSETRIDGELYKPGLYRVLVNAGAVRRALITAAFGVAYVPFVWSVLLNRRSRRLRGLVSSDPTATGACDDLRRYGYATVPLPASITDTVGRRVAEFAADPEVERQLEQGASSTGGKAYQVRLLPRTTQLDLDDPLVRAAVHPQVISAVTAYLGLVPKLVSVDAWINLPVRADEPSIASQRWHRDYEDSHIVKLFIYLSEVTADTGALEIVAGTAGNRGPLRRRPPSGADFDDDQISSAFRSERILRLDGLTGASFLVDPTSLHRGGRVNAGRRVVFTATYASLACVRPTERKWLSPPAGMPTVERFILS